MVFASYILTLFGWSGFGYWMGVRLAPGEDIAGVIGVMTFVCAMAAGLWIWKSSVVLAFVPSLFDAVNSVPLKGERRAFEDAIGPLVDKPPPSAWIFIPVSVVVCLFGAILTGFMTSGPSALELVCSYSAAGLCHGGLLCLLVRRGCLFPLSAGVVK